MATAPSPTTATAAALAAGLCWGAQAWVDLPGVLALAGAVAAAASVRGDRWDPARGLLLGVVWHGLALAWLPAAWHRFGGPGWAPLLAVVWQALPVALIQGLAGVARDRDVPLPVALGLAWMLGEGLADRWDVLPWTPALLLVDTPAAVVWAGLVGRAGLSGGLLALGGGLLAAPRAASGVLLVALGLGSVGVWRAGDRAEPTVPVGVVQPDVGALEGRRPSTADARAARLLALVRDARTDGAELVLTPEGAWPHDPGEGDGQRRRDVAAALAGTGPVLLGASVGRDVPTNSLLAVHDGQVNGRVDKRWRVPVAERRWAGAGRDRYRPGGPARTVVLGGVELAVWVCYEDLFPSAGAAAGSAALAVAATNDAWLAGRGADQHLLAARMLAVTTRRWLVRPALSGPSALVDPAGRVHWRTRWIDGDAARSDGTHAVLDVPLRPVRWWGGRLDPWSPWLGGVLLVALAVGRRRR